MKASARKRRPAPRLVLTDRDRRILTAVERFRLLTREQLQKVVGWDCTSKINARLRLLFDARLLERRFMPVRHGMAPAIYLLGPDGVAEVAKMIGVDAERLERNRREDRYSSDRLLSHALSLNDFAVLLYARLRSAADAEWQTWLNERDLIPQCHIPGAVEGAELKPDGFVRYRLGRYVFNAFLELDTGSEPAGRLQRKLDSYWEFKDTGRYTAAFRQQGFRVIIVTLSDKRTASLAARLQAPGDLKVFIGSLPALTGDVLFGSYWLRPGSTDRIGLHPSTILSEEHRP